ncbi:ATP-binding cassette domain-containing protein [Blautia schinkii]|nr:ATP-binding cassette domain-containing protein [Blautia schinkii]
MREILRIDHARMEYDRNVVLKDYNFVVNAGEIAYVQGFSESGIYALLDLFTGIRQLDGGRLYLHECPAPSVRKEILRSYGIYTITAERDLVKGMSVAENLEAVRWVRFPFRFLKKEKMRRKAEEYLGEEGLSVDTSQILNQWSSVECQKLSILKAKMHHASLIILDCMKNPGDYEGKNAEAIGLMIKKLSEEGIAFIILAGKYLPLCEIADRVQIIHKGIDLFEWNPGDKCFGNDILLGAGYLTSNPDILEEGSLHMTGFFDFEWEKERGIWKYLENIRRYAPKLWQERIGIEVPLDGVCFDGHTAVIPNTSENTLFPEMTAGDNIIMCASKRVGRGTYGIVKKKFRSLLVHTFYEITGIDESIKYLWQMKPVHRKILSIYRWEIMKPKVIIMESPYIGLGQDEIQEFCRYLRHLEQKGMRIIFFSKSMEEMRSVCSEIIVSENGRNVRYLQQYLPMQSIQPMHKN